MCQDRCFDPGTLFAVVAVGTPYSIKKSGKSRLQIKYARPESPKTTVSPERPLSLRDAAVNRCICGCFSLFRYRATNFTTGTARRNHRHDRRSSDRVERADERAGGR